MLRFDEKIETRKCNSVLQCFDEKNKNEQKTCKLTVCSVRRVTSKKLLRFEIMIPRSRACLSDKFQHHFNAVHSAVTGTDYTDLLDTV